MLEGGVEVLGRGKIPLVWLGAIQVWIELLSKSFLPRSQGPWGKIHPWHGRGGAGL